MKKLASFVTLSSQCSWKVMKENHKLIAYKERMGLWASLSEISVFAYIHGINDPKAIEAALETAKEMVLEELRVLTTKPMRPHKNPHGLVRLSGSRVSTDSFATAIKLAQQKVWHLRASHRKLQPKYAKL